MEEKEGKKEGEKLLVVAVQLWERFLVVNIGFNINVNRSANVSCIGLVVKIIVKIWFNPPSKSPNNPLITPNKPAPIRPLLPNTHL